MRGVHGQLGVVVGGRDLDHVDTGDIVLVAELTNHAEKVGAGDAARLRCAGAGRVRGIEDVDVDGDVQLVGLRQRLADRLGA